jgi:hypothetical protein
MILIPQNKTFMHMAINVYEIEYQIHFLPSTISSPDSRVYSPPNEVIVISVSRVAHQPIFQLHWDNIGTTLGQHWDNIGTTLGQHWETQIVQALDEYGSTNIDEYVYGCHAFGANTYRNWMRIFIDF